MIRFLRTSRNIVVRWPGDIRFWIILLFILRLYGITQPPLETAHNWRQSTVNMVARNFLETDPDIFHPRIDIAGEKSGITGMEFPLFNYLIYLLSLVFGYEHWYGRLINLIVSSIGAFFFYKTCRIFFKEKTVFNATLLLLFSIWLIYARKIMPDTFSASLVIMGVYFGLQYLFSQKPVGYLIFYFTFATTGLLCKIPSIILLSVMVIPIFSTRVHFRKKVHFVLINLLVVMPVFWWYYFWVPHLVEKYDFWYFFMGKNFYQGMQEIINRPLESAKKIYESAMKISGFVLFLWGLFVVFRKKNKTLISVFLLSFAVFLMFIFISGNSFTKHSYYMIPYVPFMALIAGYGLVHIKSKTFSLLLLAIVCIDGIISQQHDFRIKDKHRQIENLEKHLDIYSDRNDLILINSNENPTPMYFAHRKGWLVKNSDLMDEDKMAALHDKGARYIVVLKKAFGQAVELDQELLFKNDHYMIYRLER